MVNHCARCGRKHNVGIIPEGMEKSSEIYICGVCEKCVGEQYNEEFLNQENIEQCKEFIKVRIKKYGD